MLASAALFVLLAGLEWEGSRARWLREVHDADEARRIDALHGLATLDGSDVDEAIAASLQDRADDVRIEAALACEARRLAACAAPLSEWLGSTSLEVRAIAARVLGSVGSDADVPRLARMLGDARPQVRRAAVSGLGALGGAAAVRALVSALTDADPGVRERAVSALGELGTAAGERTMAASAAISVVRDEAPEVRAAALDALGALGDARTSAAATVGLDDDVVDVRLAAMRALTRVPSAIAVPALVQASHDDEREGRAALAALARAPGESALDALVDALQRPSVALGAEDALESRMRIDETSRAEIVRALARAIETSPSGDRTARLASTASRLSLHVSIAGLEDALGAAYRTTGSPVVLEALGRTGAEDALVPILDALASDATSTRSAALAGLEGLVAVRPADGRILDPLTLAFPRLDESEQARAVTIVGGVRSERASEWLLARVASGSRAARIAALRALRPETPASATDVLMHAIEDADSEVRTRAALALAALGASEGIRDEARGQLAAWLSSDAPYDRQAILLALAPTTRWPGATRAAAQLAILAAFDANDPELADGAAAAIAISGDDALRSAVIARFHDAGPVQRARVLRALESSGPGSEDALALALGSLDSSDARVTCAALATLSVIGDAAAVDRIAALASSMRFPENAAASFALARIAARGVRSDAMVTALAALAVSHDPYVRANVALATTHLGLSSIGAVSPIDWLAETAHPIVRAAAARWAFAVRASVDGARVDALLASCAAHPTQPSLARACSAPAIGSDVADVDLVAVDAASMPMPDRLVALRLADGSALVTYTDARGRVRLPDAPAGFLSLDAPESAVLVP